MNLTVEMSSCLPKNQSIMYVCTERVFKGVRKRKRHQKCDRYEKPAKIYAEEREKIEKESAGLWDD